jgi:DmsE family decaheme c-type cytochrome
MQNWRLKIKGGVFCLFVLASVFVLGDASTWGRVKATALPLSDRTLASRAGSADPAPDAQQSPGAEDFVGADTCRACHPNQYTWLSRTAHFATIPSPKYVPPAKGCEMCHGPGRQHVEAGGGPGNIFNPLKAPARDVVAMCTTCHQEKRLGACSFHQNQHRVDVVSCNDCHNPHQEVTHEWILRKRSPALCFDCHREIRAEFARPFHHRVPEGGMQCRDCHQQHGSFNLTQTVETVGGLSALCLRCHADKEGPFVFEHVPLRESRFLQDKCLACHVPHGSINNRMLIRSEIRLLCQECHGDRQGAPADSPQGFHDLSNPRYQHCTSCHLMIHGSNTSRLFLR